MFDFTFILNFMTKPSDLGFMKIKEVNIFDEIMSLNNTIMTLPQTNNINYIIRL